MVQAVARPPFFPSSLTKAVICEGLSVVTACSLERAFPKLLICLFWLSSSPTTVFCLVLVYLALVFNFPSQWTAFLSLQLYFSILEEKQTHFLMGQRREWFPGTASKAASKLRHRMYVVRRQQTCCVGLRDSSHCSNNKQTIEH